MIIVASRNDVRGDRHHFSEFSDVVGNALGLDGCFINQHDGNVVLNGVDAMTLRALQAFGILAIFERLLIGWANEHFKKFFSDHDCALYDI